MPEVLNLGLYGIFLQVYTQNMLLRLGQVLLATLGCVLAMPVMVVIPEVLADQHPALAVSAIAVKVMLGLVLLMASFHLYLRACFPPGSAALDDPVAHWFSQQLEALRKRSGCLWLLAQLVVLFTPILLSVLFLLTLLRPFYATMQHSAPSLGVLFVELRRTGQFLWASAKGLFLLTLSTFLGAGSALLTLYWLVRQVQAS